jgi:rhodanese-related sulfurtransferase
VIDLRSAPAYFEERAYIRDSKVSRRSTLLHNPELLENAADIQGEVVLVSATGQLASIAAAELAGRTARSIRVLSGGIASWIDAGLPVETGVAQIALTPADVLPALPDLDQKRATFADYVAWGDQITGQLDRDGLVAFRAFDEAADTDAGAFTVARTN